MKTINILLEGDKDVHFLHEFVLRRFPSFLRRNGRVGCFPITDGSWCDIGNWEDYTRVIAEQTK